MENNPENIEDIQYSKIKNFEDLNTKDISEKLFNNDLNLLNYNSFSHLGTTNLPTDFNNLTDLDYLEPDFSFLQNIKVNNNNFLLFKKQEKKVSLLDNTFENVKMNLIEEIHYKGNFEETFSVEKHKFEDNKPDFDIFSQLSYNQTRINFPFSKFKSKNNFNDYSKKHYLRSKLIIFLIKIFLILKKL